MMWMVRLALRRPYTFVVFALLILILGVLSIESMPVDIFPNINIPVVTVSWTYGGLSAEQLANRIVYQSERTLTATVSDIDHIESRTLVGIGVIKIYFHPNVNIGQAVAQVTAISQTALRTMPPGANPPGVLVFNASSVPIMQLSFSGEGLNEQQISDLATNTVRTQFATIEGSQTTAPFGGRNRQIEVDLDPAAMQAKGLSASDVTTAIGAQNIIAPAGTIKMGTLEYQVETNSAPTVLNDLNNLPIKVVNGAIVYVHDVANVRDGNAPQSNIVRVDGKRAVLLNIMKTGAASTLDIIRSLRTKLEYVRGELPPALKVRALADQSVFVAASVNGVVRETVIAACLTAIMILMFLGNWRSTVIISISIPLSILSSICLLWAFGQTINIMTLGGLALSVGILVDDATVTIENINRLLEEGVELEQAILDGSQQIVVPALVSTLSICIVFVPMFFLTGVARYLFVPMAAAVVFAMLASFLLSRTLVPTMAKFLLREHDDADAARRSTSWNPLVRAQVLFISSFESMRRGYLRTLTYAVDHAGAFIILFLVFTVGSVGLLVSWLGQDFFPTVDAGQFKIHMRAHTGTRIEETAAICDSVENTIRSQIPANEMGAMLDIIGLPFTSTNLSYLNSAPVGTYDADIQVELAPRHRPTQQYVDKIRKVLIEKYPGVMFYTSPVDIVTQILNFGLAAPIDVQIVGRNTAGNRALATRVLSEIRYVPGVVDARIQQPFNAPKLTVDVDRTRSEEVGLTQQNVAQSMLVSLSGSFQTSPTFYLDPRTGVSYSVAIQTPQYKLSSMTDLKGISVTGPGTVMQAGSSPYAFAPGAAVPASNAAAATTAPGAATKPMQVLGNLATFTPGVEQAEVAHYDIEPVLDVYANVEGTDLGSVTRRVEEVVARHQKDLPAGSHFMLRGQSETMRTSYVGLLAGLAFSILLVYLLIVVNFQSWLDPFLIISALPAALAGIVWMLFLTNTHLSVPALTGAIMCMGVATANSILVVSFARDQMKMMVGNPRQAAINAGFVRIRPVIMTAGAMIIGMLPMALSIGEGGEQNAPLGRAVIGGLLLATFATLFFVPAFFSFMHGRLDRRQKAVDAGAGTAAAFDEFD